MGGDPRCCIRLAVPPAAAPAALLLLLPLQLRATALPPPPRPAPDILLLLVPPPRLPGELLLLEPPAKLPPPRPPCILPPAALPCADPGRLCCCCAGCPLGLPAAEVGPLVTPCVLRCCVLGPPGPCWRLWAWGWECCGAACACICSVWWSLGSSCSSQSTGSVKWVGPRDCLLLPAGRVPATVRRGLQQERCHTAHQSSYVAVTGLTGR